MRITLLILLLLAIGLASCQEVNRRARLRSLIDRARKGDAEARSTLRELRLKLKQRKNEATVAQKPQRKKEVPEVTTFHPNTFPKPAPTTTTPATTTRPPQPTPVAEPVKPQIVEFPLFTASIDKPVRKPSTSRRLGPRQRVSSFEPHRAVNRGLEVSSRSEQTSSRRTEKERPPPILTTRRYSYFDDAGNYIFGYESADGSFKEEIRGKDCVVHGKYGYIDPDGVRREYTYVSGNRCDPNAPRDAELVEAPPLNDQFLHQTREQRLTADEMKIFKQSRRIHVPSRRNHQRQPIKHERIPQQQIIEPVEPVIISQDPSFTRQPPARSSRFPPFSSVKPREEKEQTVSRFPPFHGTKQAAKPNVVSSPPKPKLAPQPLPTPPTPPPRPAPTKPHQAPRPVIGSDPGVIVFDFDKEFSGLFTNFPATRRFHQPTPRPFIRPKPTTTTPFFSQDFSQLRSANPNEHHQLVYDAASRTFRTVPLNSLVTLAPNNGEEPLSLTPFKPNPLPPVPLGGLSLGNNRNKMSAKEFDNFFKNIELIVKTEPL